MAKKQSPRAAPEARPLASFAAPTRAWFEATFPAPTPAQAGAWPAIATGASTLLLAPTGSGKTLAAFLAALDAIAFAPAAPARREERLQVVYVSPLRALAVDVERNLRAPLVGIRQAAERLGVPFREPVVAVRSGDTPPRERAAFLRHGADVLITTPESLHLLLTSEARRLFAGVRTVILDEIHAVVGQKRGSHLLLTLERLESLRRVEAPLQRVGLSATQRPLELVARALGGYASPGVPRPVTIVDAGARRALEISVEVTVDDMTAPPEPAAPVSPASFEPERRSVWPSIHPRLVELVRAHRTTLVFVNNRRLAERLAAAMREVAGEEIALAHHGSVAHEKRQEIEDRLKRGTIPCIVATSSLELGIDMGSVDLVIQIEAPPSVAGGLQRVGRAGHQAGAISKGAFFPKHRGDLLAATATRAAMLEGEVEPTTLPENPLDVLAQIVVAAVSVEPVAEETLYDLVRRAAPFATLPRSAWEGVLDMLSGRYPSDDFAELRPRITWDRVGGLLTPRHGARRLAILSGGTIPDRGLYGVFLAGASEKGARRVGELDEEMVFESRPGEVFLLGASSWRIEEITHDRVLVTPAPGEPGKMPFWRGDRVGRPLSLGLRIGELARRVAATARPEAERWLRTERGLDARAAKNLVAYAHEQREATGVVPSDEAIVVERFQDELGDLRVCLLCPLGAPVLSPWAMAVATRLRDERGLDVDVLTGDDGIVFRVPEGDASVPDDLFVPDPDEVEELVLRGLDQTSLFAARFRENAGRALLLPRRRPGQRTPLWAQRKRASDLLAVASRYGSFPIVLETYRECLRDALDLPGLRAVLERVRSRAVRVVPVTTRSPSPFAATILFSYVAAFLYEGDAPLAERRAQALALDQTRLRELLGEVELRELLDEAAIAEVAARVGHEARRLAHADALHDLLLILGDVSREEIAARTAPEASPDALVAELLGARRAFEVQVGGATRLVAVEEIARYRDGLGVVMPAGVPVALLTPVKDALVGLVARYARTHGPFSIEAVAARFGLGRGAVEAVARALVASGKVLEGAFTPGARGLELCDAEVLRQIKQKSLARLRRAVEPVEPAAFARFLASWHELERPRPGLETLLGVLERLEGLALTVSTWIDDVLPARVAGFRPSDLDDLCAAGEIVWRATERVGTSDARVSFHLVDRYRLLAPPAGAPTHERAQEVLAVLERRGAVFFGDLAGHVGGFAHDVLDALWDLALAGLVTNDTTLPLRTRFGGAQKERRPRGPVRFRSRRQLPPGSEGRWALLPGHGLAGPSETDRRAALAAALLERQGVVTREGVSAEGVPGGFSAVYGVLRVMEEAGRVRRGYFIDGLGAVQLARPGVEERLRGFRDPAPEPVVHVLAATDPASPFGASLPWPAVESSPAAEGDAAAAAPRASLQRAPGAHVITLDGALVGYLARGDQALTTFLPPDEPARGRALLALASALAGWLDRGARKLIALGRIDGADASDFAGLDAFLAAGFQRSGRTVSRRRRLG